MTDRDIEERLKESDGTFTVVPFDCVYACVTADNKSAEKALHEKFKKYRVRPNREFFWLSPRTAVKAVKQYEVKDVTPAAREVFDQYLKPEDKSARRKARRMLAESEPELAKTKNLHREIKK
jgi:hypothetical protein